LDEHIAYERVFLINGDDVDKNYEKILKEHIAILYDEENSNLPMKTYRVHSASEYRTTLPITIKTRTRSGDIIAFADRDQERIYSDDSLKGIEGLGLWFQLVSERRYDIYKYAESISDRMTFLVEVEGNIIRFPK